MVSDKEWFDGLREGAYKCNACHATYASNDVPEGKRCICMVYKGKCGSPCNWTGTMFIEQRRCPRCESKIKGRRQELCRGTLLPIAKQ